MTCALRWSVRMRSSNGCPTQRPASGERVAALCSIRLRRGEVLRIGALTGRHGAVCGRRGRLRHRAGAGQRRHRYARPAGRLARPRAGGRRPPAASAAPAPASAGEVLLQGLRPRSRPRIRAVVGPQSDCFPDCEVAAFFDNEYTVGPSANRMAMRLTGRALQPQPRLRHRVGRRGARLDPGARQRPAARAAGRPADHRRLSQDRNGDLGRPAGAGAIADRREGFVRGGLGGNGRSGAPRIPRRA